MENVINVQILMSYYNGEKFIREQLESIINQSFDGYIKILIRDDGSTHSGLNKVINSIKLPANREIKLVTEQNIGPQKSFLKLIQMADDANYYFFADQDDIWLKDKVQRSVDKLNEIDASVKLYCGDYSITDSKLNIIKNSGVTLRKDTFHFLRAVMFNTFPGCVMAMDRNLLTILRKINLDDCNMHDSFAFATAIVVGEVVYDEKPIILHRIHQNNVVGYGFKKISPIKWLREKTQLLIYKESYDLSQFAENLLQVIGDSCAYYEDVCLLRDYKKSIFKTIKLLTHRDLHNKIDRCTLSIYCKILFHIF